MKKRHRARLDDVISEADTNDLRLCDRRKKEQMSDLLQSFKRYPQIFDDRSEVLSTGGARNPLISR